MSKKGSNPPPPPLPSNLFIETLSVYPKKRKPLSSCSKPELIEIIQIMDRAIVLIEKHRKEDMEKLTGKPLKFG